jgi:cell division GTPase FtsZ
VHSLITIPSDRLLNVIDRKMSIERALMEVDVVLRQGIQGISDLLTEPGLVPLAFADVKRILSEAGSARMAVGRGRGRSRSVVLLLAFEQPKTDPAAHRRAMHRQSLGDLVDGQPRRVGGQPHDGRGDARH